MTYSETNETTENLKTLISTDNESCTLACEILKGLEFPAFFKYDFLEEVKEFYVDLANKMSAINHVKAIDKAIELTKKIMIINQTMVFLLK